MIISELLNYLITYSNRTKYGLYLKNYLISVRYQTNIKENFWLDGLDIFSNSDRISRQSLLIVEDINREITVAGRLLGKLVDNCQYLSF